MLETSRSEYLSDLSLHDGLDDAQEQRLVSLLDQWMIGLENGEIPDREKLLAENQDLKAQLLDAIESIELLHRIEMPIGPTRQNRGTRLLPSGQKPTFIGNYEIGDELGRGAMGVVYSASARDSKIEVAMKVLLGTWGREPQRIERFQREARAAESLNHPSIIPVYHIGFADGYHFYTMKRIEGLSLSQIIARRSSEPKSVQRDALQEITHCRLCAAQFAEIADALHAAHSSGIVHRDVKPSNILLDRQEQMWIADFGLAQVDDGASLTQSGDLVGTFQYMSPEQSSGRPETVDRRTDIYSLGVTLYEMFAGRQPFQGLEGAHLIRAIQTNEPCKPRHWNRNLPIELETIIQRAMRPEKSDRYSTAKQLADDLRRFAVGKPIRASRVTFAERLTRWSSRHAGIVLSGFIIAIGYIAALSAHNWMMDHEKTRTLAELIRGNSNYRQARVVVDTLGLHVADRLQSIPGAESLQQEVLAETLYYYETFIAASNTDPRLVADVAQTRLKIARLIRIAGNINDAINAYEKALEALRTASLKKNDQAIFVTLIQSLNELAVIQSEQGNQSSAVQNLEEARLIVPRLVQETDRWVAQALLHNNSAIIAARKHDTAMAVREAKIAVEILSQLSMKAKDSSARDASLSDSLRQDTADALGNLSVMLSDSGNDSDAVTIAERALAIRREFLQNQSSPDQLRRLALSYNNLAALEWRSGRVEPAIVSYQSSIQLLELAIVRVPGQLGPRHELAVTLNNLGMALATTPKLAEAVNVFQRAIAIASPAADADPQNAEAAKSAGGIWNNLGVLLQNTTEQEACLDAFTHAVKYQQRVCDKNRNNESEQSLLRQYETNLTAVKSTNRINRVAGEKRL